MKKFLDKDFLLETDTARMLYHQYAAAMPIFDYHCHLSAKEIWENQPYRNIAEVWLGGDHYKWRAMRSNGIPESHITGSASYREKFQAWAQTIPHAIGNPLYHWTHLELQRYFGIDTVLNEHSAEKIWYEANEKLAGAGFRPRDFMAKSKVELVCSTDDPCDNLEYHQKIQDSPDIPCRVLPTFRPDAAVNIERETFPAWLVKLDSGRELNSWGKLQDALSLRLDFFAQVGCKLSDHGMDEIYFEPAAEAEIDAILKKRLSGEPLSQSQVARYKTALWCFLGQEYSRRGWVMQLHLGAMRSNNSRMLSAVGPDSGFDSIGDAPLARPLAHFLDFLDRQERLPKTILYNLNAKDNHVLASMLGNFQGDGIPGKLQFGSAWWFCDHQDGMEAQMRSLANLGLLSHFIGMLTDSRSFLSYPRHEYFRRILCNLLGRWVEHGEYPGDLPFLGQMVENICYYNAKNYLGL